MKTKTKENKFRKSKDLKLLSSFLYNGLGGKILHIEIYDKITKKVYAGNIGISSWSLKDKLKELKQ